MRHPGNFALTLLSASVCLMLTGCFSYSKEETSRAMPSAEVPSTSTSSTTTTTRNDNGIVERQHTTTYTNP
jgi:hypothetical protein